MKLEGGGAKKVKAEGGRGTGKLSEPVRSIPGFMCA